MVVGRWAVLWAWLVVWSVPRVASSQGQDVPPLALPPGQPPTLCIPQLSTHPLTRCEVRKRQPFYHWGGKRSNLKAGDQGLPLNLREVYLALFQKARSQLPRPQLPKPQASEGELKRAAFNPWGGKRSHPVLVASLASDTVHDSPNHNTFIPVGETPFKYIKDATPVEKETIPHTAALSDEEQEGEDSFDADNEKEIWDEEPSNLLLLDENVFIPAVDNQRYKREVESYTKSLENRENSQEKTETEGDKPIPKDVQPQDIIPAETKRIRFSAWAGKRPDLQALQNAVRRLAGPEPRMAERRAFSAWAGKRSSEASHQDVQNKAIMAWIGKNLPTTQLTMADKRAFSAWAGKRSSDHLDGQITNEVTKFSPWAGKQLEETIPGDNDLAVRTINDEDSLSDDQKRSSFSAWAGKRSDDEKRQSFSAWAGKRSHNDEKRDNFSEWVGKQNDNDKRQQAFSAWAGKRNDNNEKRQAFSPWAGKRSDNNEKRQAFSPWAGKRSDNNEKRQAFSPWAGKRSDNNEKRQAFSPWAGKRSDNNEKRQAFSPWAGKRSDNNEKRQAFSPWAGKRSDNNEKQQAFSAWAGKRNGYNQVSKVALQQISYLLQQLHNQNQNCSHKRVSLNNWAKTHVPFITMGDNRLNSLPRETQTSDLFLPDI